MSTEQESFFARWSRRKRAAEREPATPADNAAPQPLPASAQVADRAAATDAPVSALAHGCEPAPTNDVPLPPIESLDGLRSDYQAFFQQPVGDELRHAALKKLFADPHFNQMDMLDVYVDDYTQFEPLPAALRLRLPSARAFLLDSERVPEAAENGAVADAPESSTARLGAGREGAASDAADEKCGLAASDAGVQSTSGLIAEGSSATAAAPSDDSDRPDVSSSHAALPRSNRK